MKAIILLTIATIFRPWIVQAQERVNPDLAEVRQIADKMVKGRAKIGTDKSVGCPMPAPLFGLFVTQYCQEFDGILIIVQGAPNPPYIPIAMNRYKVVFKNTVDKTRQAAILDKVAKYPTFEGSQLTGVYSLPPYTNKDDGALFKAAIERGYEAVVLNEVIYLRRRNPL